MRLLYVGLTRARDALWLCGGAAGVQRATPRCIACSAATLPRAGLQPTLDGAARPAAERSPPTTVTRLPPHAAPTRARARARRNAACAATGGSTASASCTGSTRTARRRWPTKRRADDERAAGDACRQRVDPALRFAGTRFGNALHDALEHVDFARWRDCDGSTCPTAQAAMPASGAAAAGLRRRRLSTTACANSRRWSRARSTRCRCPEGVRLCDVPRATRVAELEFHFTLADADAHALLALLHAHGIARGRRDFGAWPRLAGLMTGKIDLTYRVDGRVYVLDYKSNRLPDYDDADAARRRWRASEYDLQALLYVVAAASLAALAAAAPRYDYDTRLRRRALPVLPRPAMPRDPRAASPRWTFAARRWSKRVDALLRRRSRA